MTIKLSEGIELSISKIFLVLWAVLFTASMGISVLSAQILARHADTAKRAGASQIKVVNGKCVVPRMYIPKVGASRFPAERQVIHNFELLNVYFDCIKDKQ